MPGKNNIRLCSTVPGKYFKNFSSAQIGHLVHCVNSHAQEEQTKLHQGKNQVKNEKKKEKIDKDKNKDKTNITFSLNQEVKFCKDKIIRTKSENSKFITEENTEEKKSFNSQTHLLNKVDEDCLPKIEIYRTKESSGEDKLSLSLNQLEQDDKDDKLINYISLNQLGQEPINTKLSLNEVGKKTTNEHSLNEIGHDQKDREIDSMQRNFNHSEKDKGNKSKNYISLNQLEQEPIIFENSLNKLGKMTTNEHFLNELGNDHNDNKVGKEIDNISISLNHLGKDTTNKSKKDTSLNQLGQKPIIVKHSLNELGKMITKKHSLNETGHDHKDKEINNVSKSLNHLEKDMANKVNNNISLNQLGQEPIITEQSLNQLGKTTTTELSLNEITYNQKDKEVDNISISLNHLEKDKRTKKIKNGISLNHLGQKSKNVDNSLNELGDKTTKNSSDKVGDVSLDFSYSDRSHEEKSSVTSSDSEHEEDNKFKYFSSEFYTVLYTNVDQSLTGKMNELLGQIDLHKPSIIMITEIEPKAKKDMTKQIKDSEINIPNYSLFTNKDRKRGVALYIDKKLNPRDCTQAINKKFEECVFCEFEGALNEKTLIGCMYKSPNTSKENVERMLETLTNEAIAHYDTICIAGDFNYPKISWDGTNSNKGDNEIFVECLKDAYLIQKVTKPTRNVRLDQQANIVDLVLTNEESMISEIVHCAPLGASDHDVLLFQINVPKKTKENVKEKRFNLAKGNYKAMRKDLQKVNWGEIEKLEVEDSWQKIKDEIVKSMNKNIPKSKKKEKENQNPYWMNGKIMRKIKKSIMLIKDF